MDIDLDPGRLSRALVGGTQVWMDGQKFPHVLQDFGRCPKKLKQQKWDQPQSTKNTEWVAVVVAVAAAAVAGSLF